MPQLQLVRSQTKDIKRQIDAALEQRCQSPQEAQPAETDSGLHSDMETLRSMSGWVSNVSSGLYSEASVHLSAKIIER